MSGSQRVPKVSAGDPLTIRAPHWNAMADAANAYAEGRMNQGGGPLYGNMPGVIIPIRNNTQVNQDRLAVLGLDWPVFPSSGDWDTFVANRAFDAVVPADPDHVGRFAVLLAPAAPYEIVPGAVAGPCPVRIDVNDTNEARFADILDGSTDHLTTGPTGGAYVLWRARQLEWPGTGVQSAIIMLGTPSWPERAVGSDYMVHMLKTTGGVQRPVWDWPRLHQ